MFYHGGMPGAPDPPIQFQTLHEGPIIRIREYDCHARFGGPGAEEESGTHSIVLMRHGAFCRHVEHESATADVNQVAFFSQGSVCQVSHPVDCGDRGTVFVVSPRVLHDIVCELDQSMDERPGQPFPFLSGPCDASVFWRHRALVQRLSGQGPIEPFWVEETALQIAADVLESAFTSRGRATRSRKADTRSGHADLAEAAKAHLAGGLGERLTLDDLARAVHASPFHLARVFQQRTGITIHRYLTLLRLRASLERLAQGQEDLTALALDLGFSSHSHFTDTFRREFGCTPSEIRKGDLHEMSKNLEV
jgi:AraC family transcriptional regulator